MQLHLYMEAYAQLLFRTVVVCLHFPRLHSIDLCIKAQNRGRNKCYKNNWNEMQQLFDNKATKICLTKSSEAFCYRQHLRKCTFNQGSYIYSNLESSFYTATIYCFFFKCLFKLVICLKKIKTSSPISFPFTHQ